MPDFSQLDGFLSSALAGTVGGIIGAVIALLVNVRVGKNQEDRVELRQIYTSIRQNFIRMLDTLRKGHPMTRRSYGMIDHGVEACFLTDDSTETTNEKFLIIPHNILCDLQDAERRTLDFGDELYRQAHGVWKTAVEKLESMKTKEIQRPNDGRFIIVGREKHHLGVKRWLAELSLMGMLVDDSLYPKTVSNLQREGDVLLRLDVLYDYEIEINPDSLEEMSTLEFLEFVRKTGVELPSVPALREQRKMLETELQNVIRRLDARIQDPHPLLETLVTAVKDIFRRH